MTRVVVMSAVVVLLAVSAACGRRAHTSGAAKRDDAIVWIDCDVSDAVVWVNGELLREVAELAGGIALSPGTHRIEITHDRYHTRYFVLDLAARERRRLRVELAEILP